MTETPQLFGPDSTLVGVLTQPAHDDKAAVAFLMFNAGVLPRIGPHRLNVKVARALAGAGQTSLRFDLSGQGDSRGAGSGADFRAQAVLDLRCAMDHLEKTHGIRRFALIGWCSGATNSFAAAMADTRVCGVLMFDGHWYRTRWTLPVRHWKRFRAAPWSNIAAAIGRRLLRALKRKSATVVPTEAGLFSNNATPANPPRTEFVQAVNSLVMRGVAILFVYSGSVIEYFSYGNQFRDAFGRERFVGKVQCYFRPDIDHTFATIEVQRRMTDIVLNWVPEVQRACTGLT